MRISELNVADVRFPLAHGVGSDALHSNPTYSLAVCMIRADSGETGTGFSLTLGAGNDLVCAAVELYRSYLLGKEPEELVASLGEHWHRWANDGQLRWLGPQKGVIHLALAAMVGALMDLWSRSRGLPLWKALLSLSPEEVIALVDFSTISDQLSPDDALTLLREGRLPRSEAEKLEQTGYPAYDTSVGWLGYTVEELVEKVVAAQEAGYSAVKVKVGSPDLTSDGKRLAAVRGVLREGSRLMIDANQRWSVPEAVEAGRAFQEFVPFWFEEPVHPDDLAGYVEVGKALRPMSIAGGEHIPNQVVFKNFFRAGALQVAQPDVVRLGGLPEYLGVALMGALSGVPVLPHVGDMGQIHQHLVLFTRVALGAPELPLEMIPHLAEHFTEPCNIVAGRYRAPSAPGSSSAIRHESIRRFRWPGVS